MIHGMEDCPTFHVIALATSIPFKFALEEEF